MAAESDLLGVMVIAAWAVHSETAKGMKYSASRYLAYLMRNPQKVAAVLVLKAPVAMFFDEMQSHAVDGGLQIPVLRALNPGG